jgi:hypothetical protein
MKIVARDMIADATPIASEFETLDITNQKAYPENIAITVSIRT